jgi:ubiquinone/menaquinone biosynthesis C-methylase UbiE
MARLLDRFQYGVAQSARVAWYAGHYLALRRVSGNRPRTKEERYKIEGQLPSRDEMMRSMRDLLEKDWRNIEQGIYAKPYDMKAPDFRKLARASVRFWRDAKKVDERRMAKGHSEVNTEDRRDKFPRYYLQNFHYQTDGWLSEDSARLYDTQVEVLFTGTADAMRRMALVPLREALEGTDPREAHLLDVASGTGRFLTFVKDNYPRLNTTALDLSPDYMKLARENLSKWSATEFIEANAEAMPLEDASQDVVTCIYLFHELPPKIRRVIAAEIARVLKPGGTFIMVDSLQFGDAPAWDSILESFPQNFHEPYYASYLSEDLPSIFGDVGVTFQWSDVGFLSKLAVFRKV